MLRPDQVMKVIEGMLEGGEDRRDTIVAKVALALDMNVFELQRLAADKAVSLALAAMRDEDGNRIAFPGRNENGERVVIHTTYTTDARAMHQAGVRLQRVGENMIKAGTRLQVRAMQLGLFDTDAEVA